MRRLAWLILLLVAATVYAQVGESFVLGNVNSVDVYVGEPIIYTLRIHLLGEVTDESQVITPSFTGFGSSSMQIAPSVATETIDSFLYTIYEQNYLLYPLRIGTLTIEPFQVQMPETPFQNAVTISTEPLTVTVKALPPEAPESFRNAVGQYEVEASVNLSELRSGDALTLTLNVSGSGNIEQVLAPNLILPEGWRVFVGDSEFQQESIVFGRKTFTWTIFPIGEGAVEIPSIEFSYFNPQTEAYESRGTAAIPLTLSPSAAVAAPIIPTRNALAAPPAPLMQPQFGLAPNPPIWFWGVWLVPPLFSLGIWVLRRPRIEKEVPQAKKPSGSRALQTFRRQLKAAQSAEPKAAYVQIEAALVAYLSAKTGQKVELSNIDKLFAKLPVPLQEEIILCLEEAGTGRYAPIRQNDVVELMRRSLAVVNAIEKEKA
jgi:hypothetical protein